MPLYYPLTISSDFFYEIYPAINEIVDSLLYPSSIIRSNYTKYYKRLITRLLLFIGQGSISEILYNHINRNYHVKYIAQYILYGIDVLWPNGQVYFLLRCSGGHMNREHRKR